MGCAVIPQSQWDLLLLFRVDVNHYVKDADDMLRESLSKVKRGAKVKI